MRRLTIAVLLLLTAPALADDTQIDTVTVTRNSLVGLWRVNAPNSVGKAGLFSPLVWGPLHDRFCRIVSQKDSLAIFCSRNGQAGVVANEGTHVHLAWGTMMARVDIDGELTSDAHFGGHFQIKLAGITFEDPNLSEGTRVTFDPDTPDKPGKAALLRKILSDGLSSVPRDETAMKKDSSSNDIPNLGAISAIAYLGQELKPGTANPDDDAKTNANIMPDQPDFYSVYLVTFADGERLCTLHQRDDGVLDSFGCI